MNTRSRARALGLLAVHAMVGGVGCLPPDAAPCATCPPPAFPAGSMPNDVALSRCDDRAVALVADSGEARLHAIHLDDGSVRASTVFGTLTGPSGDRFASPWAVAVTPDGARAAVTLFGQDRVAWVEPCAGTVLHVVAVDGAVTPQPVAVTPEGVVAAFTNVRRFSHDGEPPELDPGLVVLFNTEGDRLVRAAHATLPCRNPQGLAVALPELVVSCSGPLARGPDGGQAAMDDGAIVRLDATTLHVKHVHPAGRLAPGTPVVTERGLVAGSLVDPRLMAVPSDGMSRDAPLVAGPLMAGTAVDALFEAVRWDDDTTLVTRFSADAILVLSDTAAEPTTVPDVVHTIKVGPGGVAFRGLLALDVRRELALEPGAVDAVALLGLSAEVVPLALHEVLHEVPHEVLHEVLP